MREKFAIGKVYLSDVFDIISWYISQYFGDWKEEANIFAKLLCEDGNKP